MINLICGNKGSGKTKQLIEKVNAAAGVASGNVVFISDNTKKNMYDIKSKVRMIDTSDFEIKTLETLYGFISGIISGNYDITDIFVDGVLRMVDYKTEGLESFAGKLDKVASEHGNNIFMTLSIDPAELSEDVKKFI